MLGLGNTLSGGIVPAAAAASNPFTFTVDTTDSNGSASDTFVLPLLDDGVIDINVDWGDDSTSNITEHDDAAVTHVYSASGTYTIEMSGTIRGFRFAGGGDRRKMRVISQWGDFNMTFSNTFQDCRDLTVTASDAPTISTTNMGSTFYRCGELTDLGTGISSWNVSNVTSFSKLFYQDTKFNGDVSSWEVGAGENFSNMFYRNNPFNADISGWDTSSATNMNSMLRTHMAPYGNFDQDLSAWDISNVTDMTSILTGQTLSTSIYDEILTAWADQSVQSDLTPNFGNSTYTSGGEAEDARTILIETYNWTITDGGAAG
jgi:surface protein